MKTEESAFTEQVEEGHTELEQNPRSVQHAAVTVLQLMSELWKLQISDLGKKFYK